MDRYTIDALKAMIGKELDECVAHGIKSHEDLDIVKDLTMTLKNIYKIEKYEMEESDTKKHDSWDKKEAPSMY